MCGDRDYLCWEQIGICAGDTTVYVKSNPKFYVESTTKFWSEIDTTFVWSTEQNLLEARLKFVCIAKLFARKSDQNFLRGEQTKIFAESRTKFARGAEQNMCVSVVLQWKVPDTGKPEQSKSEKPIYLLKIYT